MEDLPKIYQMKKDKHFNNNKEVYMSNMRDDHNEVLSIIDMFAPESSINKTFSLFISFCIIGILISSL